MSDSLRYKIVLWMVWVQIALAPIICMMVYVTNSGMMWRWNLINNLMVGGYVLGLLALPICHGLEKPKLLKWWLRIDFCCSLIPAIIALPLLFYNGRHYIDAEYGKYVLYHTTGVLAASPRYSLGKKDGLFIRDMSKTVIINDYDDRKIDCFRVDTLRGCFYGLNRGSAQASWVLPLDSVKYHQYAADIIALIDSIYQAQPLFMDYYHGTFVFPDNFAEINYDSNNIGYEDTISYDIEFHENDCVHVRIYNNKFTHLVYPRNSVGNFSPKEVRAFVENMKENKE